MNKYMVTGAAGFVGHHLVAHLLKNNYEVLGIDNFSSGKKEFLEPFKNNKSFKLFEYDITYSKLISEIIRSEKPDTVIHLAALHFIPYCMAHPRETLNVNLVGTQTLLDTLKDSSVKKFVFISTGDVYEPADSTHKETDSLKPFNIYGLSKLMGEQLIELTEKDLPDIKFNIVRLFNVYGAGETNPHILPDIINYLKKGRTLNLGNISPVRDYIYTEDVVEGLIRISNYSGNEKVFNLAGGSPVSVIEMINLIEEILKEKIEIQTDYSKLRKVERQTLKADLSRLKQELNWLPQTSLKNGLIKIFQTEL